MRVASKDGLRMALTLSLSLGLFVQICGKVWLESNSAQNSQVYIWLLTPALVWVISKAIGRSLVWPDAIYVPWIAYLVWVALSTLWATNSEADAWSVAKRGVFIGLYLIAIHLLMVKNSTYFRRGLLASFVVVTIGALATLVYQYGVLDRPLSFRGFRVDRLGIGDYANYGWPVAAGIFHGAIATWVFGIVLDRRTSPSMSMFWLFCFFVLAAYVLLTYTRGAWIALAACCLLVTVIHNSKRSWIILGLLGAIALVGVVLTWDHLLIEIQRRQFSGRGKIWEYFFSVMPDHWLLGYGLGTPFEYVWPNNFAVSPHAHSLYLQQVYDSGLVSLMLMILGLAVLVCRAYISKHNEWVKLAFPSLIFSLITMLTDVERIFTRPGDYWLVFWLPVAVLLSVCCRKPGLSLPKVGA